MPILYHPHRPSPIPRAADGASGGAPTAEAPSGGAAAAGNPSGGTSTTDPSPGATTGTPDAAGWTKPDWLPDHLSGATPAEALEKTFKAFDGYRQTAAKRGEVPKDAAGYTFTPPDDLKAYFGENDPVLAATAPIAHKLGLSKGEYEAFIGGTLAEMAKAGTLPPPFDPAAEFAKVGKGLNLPDTAEGKAELARVVEDTVAFAENLGAQLGLAEGSKAMLAALADTGDGLLALKAIMGRMGTRGPQADGRQGGAGAATKEDLKAMAGDSRIDPTSSKYDQRVRDQYDADYRRLFPS